MSRRKASNLWHPLPPDYGELTPEGQRQARVFVVKNVDTPEGLVDAWSFFRDYYLTPDDTGVTFYRGAKKLPSPEFHAQMVYELGRYDLNVWAAPRGSAKSVVLGTEIPLLFLLAKPSIETVVTLATERMIESRFDKIMQQLEGNKFLSDDFGRLKPKRGAGIWSRSQLRLTNGATLSGYPVLGRKRGFRPQLYLLDDPEYDKRSATTDLDKIHSEFEELLFKVILPALDEGARLFWLGTMITRRSFLYYACTSDDPRFRHWNRRILPAVEGPLADTNKQLLWPEKWSIKRLRQIRDRVGPSYFSSEFLNNPISSTERTFVLEPKLHYYYLEPNDDLSTHDLAKGMLPDPLTCKYPVLSYDKREERILPTGGLREGDEVTIPAPIRKEAIFHEFLEGLFRLMTVDYGATGRKKTDYCCAHVMGLCRENNLWSLDMYLGRPSSDDEFRRIIYALALRWRVKIIGVENVAKQVELEQSVRDYFEAAAVTSGWLPRVVGVGRGKAGYRFVAKGDRIASLTWRFSRGRIKLPGNRVGLWPYSALIHQIENFTPDLSMLVNDDALDTMAMVQYMVAGRGHTASPDADRMEWVERILRGETVDESGMPLTAGVDLTKLSPDIVQKILDTAKDRDYSEEGRRRVHTLRRIL